MAAALLLWSFSFHPLTSDSEYLLLRPIRNHATNTFLTQAQVAGNSTEETNWEDRLVNLVTCIVSKALQGSLAFLPYKSPTPTSAMNISVQGKCFNL